MPTASSTRCSVQRQEVDLHVDPLIGNEVTILRKVWSFKKLPISAKSAPRYRDFRHIPYLQDIDRDSVMFLIDTDTPSTHITLEVRSGGQNEPCAIRTKLGWTVRGSVPDMDNYTTNKVSID